MPDKPHVNKCPLCRAPLDAGPDDTLICSAKPHYRIGRQIFELAWQKYDAGGLTAEGLLTILVKGNKVSEELREKFGGGEGV